MEVSVLLNQGVVGYFRCFSSSISKHLCSHRVPTHDFRHDAYAGCIELYSLGSCSDIATLPKADNEGASSDDESLSEFWTGVDIPRWKAALASESVLTVHDLHAPSSKQPVQWTFPYTLQDKQRHAVFVDLYLKRCELLACDAEYDAMSFMCSQPGTCALTFAKVSRQDDIISLDVAGTF